MQIAAPLPKERQGDGKAERRLERAVRERPAQCRAQVVMLLLKVLEATRLIGPNKRARVALGQQQEEVTVLPSYAFGLAGLAQFLSGVLACRLGQCVARLPLA